MVDLTNLFIGADLLKALLQLAESHLIDPPKDIRLGVLKAPVSGEAGHFLNLPFHCWSRRIRRFCELGFRQVRVDPYWTRSIEFEWNEQRLDNNNDQWDKKGEMVLKNAKNGDVQMSTGSRVRFRRPATRHCCPYSQLKLQITNRRSFRSERVSFTWAWYFSAKRIIPSVVPKISVPKLISRTRKQWLSVSSLMFAPNSLSPVEADDVVEPLIIEIVST